MRLRAAELATEWLGLREITESLSHEVEQERWTSLDRDLQQRACEGEEREYSIFATSEGSAPLTGRIVDKGFADELTDRGYLIIDGTDGRLHHVALSSSIDLGDLPTGSIVTARSAVEPRAADRTIAEVAEQGIYRSSRHLEIAEKSARRGQDARSYVQWHVRRLEALRKTGIVERIAEGVWTVPKDLVERGQAYDARRIDGAQVDVHSYFPIDQQKRAIGATWLDRQLLAGEANLSAKGLWRDDK
jgi:hypothetical protein